VDNFVANFLQYLCAKNFQNTKRFDKIIAKIKRCKIDPYSVVYIAYIGAGELLRSHRIERCLDVALRAP